MKTDAIWVIIPAHNEARHLGQVIDQVSQITPHLLIVDDGSRDNTYAIATKYAPIVLRHRLNLGKGATLKTGCEYAFSHLKATAVIFFDADGQHSSSDLPQFFTRLNQGHHVILGVRQFNRTMPLSRRLGNRALSLLTRWFFGVYLPDIPSGFKALSKSAYTTLQWHASDYGVELEIAARLAKSHLDYITVPIHTIYHGYFRGMTFFEGIRILIQLIKLKVSL